jgi:hypothetical protein
MKSRTESQYDWAIMPDDLPKKNLVLITAKTPHPTFHKEDKKYPVRLFTTEELHEAARSLAHRAIGLNHLGTIEKAFTVDAQFNKSTNNVEALCYFPDEWIGKVRNLLNEGKESIFSVEYTWRDERYTEAGVEFIGLIFDKVDLLCGMNAGDKYTSAKLVESAIQLSSRRACMEAEVIPELGAAPIQQEQIQSAVECSKECNECKTECNKRVEYSSSRNLAQNGESEVQVPEETNLLNNSPQSPISLIPEPQEPEGPVMVAGRVINDANQEGDVSIPDPNSPEEQLKAGIKIEMEHTSDPKEAEKIAKDHLAEFPNYYTELVKMEDKLKDNKEGKESQSNLEDKNMPEEKKEEVKSEEKKEEAVVPPTPDPKLVEAQAQLLIKDNEIKAKDERIKEVEIAFNRLQENAKSFDTQKADAVVKARKEGKLEVIDRVSKAIPSSAFISGNNVGATRSLITDVKKALYESENSK